MTRRKAATTPKTTGLRLASFMAPPQCPRRGGRGVTDPDGTIDIRSASVSRRALVGPENRIRGRARREDSLLIAYGPNLDLLEIALLVRRPSVIRSTKRHYAGVSGDH